MKAENVFLIKNGQMIKILTLLFLIILSFNVFAQNVPLETAQIVASNWYRHYAPSDKKSAIIIKTVEYKLKETTNFYIFTFNKGGFVIVSANDQVVPVLGYGFEGNVPDKIDNPSIKYWLDGYAQQIDSIGKSNLFSTKVNSTWKQLRSKVFLQSTGKSIDPLLTTSWNQSWPYNTLCPNNAPPGCTAIAMAQILKYHNYPSQGLGSHGYTYGSYPYTEANFGVTTYNWANMPNSISVINNDVATIIYQAAVSINSAWDPKGTVSGLNCAELAYVNYFRMAFSTIEQVSKINYTDTDWDNILRTELENDRPILYAGNRPPDTGKPGHAFVCDGVDANNMYHFNFGWGGTADGYYYLNNINPGDTYTFQQEALIGIKPNDGSTITSNTTWSGMQSISTPLAFPDGITLTINPGTKIKFKEGSWLQIYGSINAVGKDNDSILITANDTLAGWPGIKIDHIFENVYENTTMKDNDTSRFDYCNISYAKEFGLYLNRIDKININHSRFQNNNTTHNGGAISADLTNLNIYNSTFNNNNILGHGGALYAWGKNIRVYNSHFYNNKANNNGGAIYLYEVDSNSIIQDNIIIGNSALMGGGIEINHCSPNIRSNVICNNKASVGGGALCFMIHSGGIINNNLIANNTAISEFGGGALLAYIYSSPIFINNTIVNNFSQNYGGCAYMWDNSNPIFKNCIIYGNDSRYDSDKPFYITTSDSYPSFYYCDLQNDISNFSITNQNSITAEPVFVAPSSVAGIDYDGVAANWQLQSTSPCIDAGTLDTTNLNLPEKDLSGNPRISYNHIDIGAYEYINSVANIKPTSTYQENSLVYPNPSKGVFKIEGLQANQKNKITVYTLDCKLIYKKISNLHTESIDMSDQVSGMYLLFINNQSFKIRKE